MESESLESIELSLKHTSDQIKANPDAQKKLWLSQAVLNLSHSKAILTEGRSASIKKS